MKLSKKRLKWVTISLATAILLSSNAAIANADGDLQLNSHVSQETQIDLESIKYKIPTTFEPGAILTYDAQQEPIITYDTSAKDHAGDTQSSIRLSQVEEKVANDEEIAAEDAFFKSVEQSVKDLPVTDFGYDLPEPTPGTVVMYGSDGRINRIYVDESIASNPSIAAVPSTTFPYPGHLLARHIQIGTKINHSTNAVIQGGRFADFCKWSW